MAHTLICNGIALDVATFGTPANRALVLVRGLGSQRIHWPDALIQGFVDRGFFVVTFDNRDAGQSARVTRPYTLSDMAQDVVGLMDRLDLPRAHVFGISMGGMIVQLLARAHPDRVQSATIAISSSMAPNLPPASDAVRAALVSEPDDPSREAAIAHGLATGALWASPAYPFDPVERADVIGRAFDRDAAPGGAARQYAAIHASIDDLARIDEITAPTLVIQGGDDAIFSVAHGQDIAARITGARYVEVPGMGHDIEGEMRVRIVDMVADFIDQLPGQG